MNTVQVINAQLSFGSQFQYDPHASLAHTAPERRPMVKKDEPYTYKTRTPMIQLLNQLGPVDALVMLSQNTYTNSDQLCIIKYKFYPLIEVINSVRGCL